VANSFLSEDELRGVGFRSFGTNVLVSRRASIYSPETIQLGSHVRIDDFCILSGGAEITIGSYVHIAAYSALYGAGTVAIEDFASLSARVTVYSESDDYSGNALTGPMVPRRYRESISRGPVVLRRHSILGVASTVMPNVTLEEGAAVGAHSFVVRNCDPWSVYFGAPAKKVNERSRRVLELESDFLKDQR
jgi:galactoside O-acetyltransferase